jgi:hypothetical protein
VVDQLIPKIANPRTHSREQVANIAASIREFGWTNPIPQYPETSVSLQISGTRRHKYRPYWRSVMTKMYTIVNMVGYGEIWNVKSASDR